MSVFLLLLRPFFHPFASESKGGEGSPSKFVHPFLLRIPPFPTVPPTPFFPPLQLHTVHMQLQQQQQQLRHWLSPIFHCSCQTHSPSKVGPVSKWFHPFPSLPSLACTQKSEENNHPSMLWGGGLSVKGFAKYGNFPRKFPFANSVFGRHLI